MPQMVCTGMRLAAAARRREPGNIISMAFNACLCRLGVSSAGASASQAGSWHPSPATGGSTQLTCVLQTASDRLPISDICLAFPCECFHDRFPHPAGRQGGEASCFGPDCTVDLAIATGRTRSDGRAARAGQRAC